MCIRDRFADAYMVAGLELQVCPTTGEVSCGALDSTHRSAKKRYREPVDPIRRQQQRACEEQQQVGDVKMEESVTPHATSVGVTAAPYQLRLLTCDEQDVVRYYSYR